jgi:hypothetical protein
MTMLQKYWFMNICKMNLFHLIVILVTQKVTVMMKLTSLLLLFHLILPHFTTPSHHLSQKRYA